MALVDTHCHLNFNLFTDDLDDVLQRAHKSNISRIVIPGSDLETSRLAVELTKKYPSLYAAVGVHPNDSNTWNMDTIATLEDLAKHPRVVAIGEIGLDYHHTHSSQTQQHQVLHAQLEIAARIGKPVILHSREAFSDLWEIITGWLDTLQLDGKAIASYPGVFHAFEGNLDDALQVFTRGFFIGIGGPVTYKNALNRQSTATGIPLDAILLETDAPFLTPHPHRGQRNEPSHLHFIAEKIAGLKQIPILEVEEMTTQNAGRLFNWRDL